MAIGSAPGTVNRYIATISKVFTHAVDEQVMMTAPRIKFMQDRRIKVHFFTEAEVDELIAYFHDLDTEWMADVVLLAVKTGMRKLEIIALGEGAVSITSDGNWIELTPEVTKTSKYRAAPLGLEASEAAATRAAKRSGKYVVKALGNRPITAYSSADG